MPTYRATITPEAAEAMRKSLEQQPNFDIEPFSTGDVAVQLNGSDIIHISHDSRGRWLYIRVFDSTHPDAAVVWEGEIAWENQDRLEDN